MKKHLGDLSFFTKALFVASLALIISCQEQTAVAEEKTNKLSKPSIENDELKPEWQVCFPSDALIPSDTGTDIIATREGSTVVTGLFEKRTSDNLGFPKTSLVSNISPTGVVNWITELGPHVATKKLLITDKQNIIAVGHTRVKLGKNNATIHKLSKDGQILFTKKLFEEEYWSKITDVEKLDSSHFLISGTLKNVESKGAKSEVFLAQMNLNGKKDWVRKFSEVERPSNVQLLQNQNGERFLVLNESERIRTRTEKGIKSSNKSSLAVLKINKAGVVEEIFRLKDNKSKSNLRALYTQSGKIFITYINRDKVAKKTTLSLIILNDDLSVKYQAGITDKPIQINDIEQSEDGTIYVTGHTNQKGYGKRDIWLGTFSTNGKLLGEKHLNIEDNNEWANAFYLDEENRKMLFTGQRRKDKSQDRSAFQNSGSCLWVIQTTL